MRDDDFILIRSFVGATALFLLGLAFCDLARLPPWLSLWLPMNGALQLNSEILKWLFASIPLGASIGCATSGRRKANLRARSYFSSWFCGCIASLVFAWYLCYYLDVSTTLPICAVGLLVCGGLFSLSKTRAHRKPPRIPRQW